MTACKALFLSFFIMSLVFGQTDFKNTCQNSSLIPLLATGVINLNPMDTFNAGANKAYYQDLSLAKFTAVDVLGYAFALSSFQTTCTQTFYALAVDVVEFQNQNTRMRIVVNFRSTNLNIITKWTQVTFTYIVVSRFLNGAYSDIWATVAESTLVTSIANAPVDRIASVFGTDPATTNVCQMYVDPLLVIDLAGCSDVTAATGADGGTTIIHAYIMGFQWNPARSNTNFLAASVLKGDGVVTPESDS